jgi:peptidoglycan/LPS O-acetylase OafA/YrhL
MSGFRLGHVPELDSVRGIACLLVIILHVVVGAIPLPAGSFFEAARLHIQPFMSGGVDLFFILSGFLISGALMDSRNEHGYFKAFWTRRIARIFPVFFMLITASLILRLIYETHPLRVLASLVYSSLPEGYYFIFSQNIAALAYHNPGNSILGVTWSLAIEEQFYLFFPFVVFFLRRRSVLLAAFAVVIATPFIRALVVSQLGWQAGYLATFTRMDALMLGVALACIVRSAAAFRIAARWQRPLNCVAVILLTLQLGGFWNYVAEHYALAFLDHGYLYLVLIACQFPLLNIAMAILFMNIFTRESGAFRPLLRSKLLASVGLISYGLYMYHQIFNFGLWMMIQDAAPVQLTIDKVYMPVLVLAASLATSWLSLRYFELPARRRITNFSRSHSLADLIPARRVGHRRALDAVRTVADLSTPDSERVAPKDAPGYRPLNEDVSWQPSA